MKALLLLTCLTLCSCNMFGFTRTGSPYAFVTGNLGSPSAFQYGGNASVAGASGGSNGGVNGQHSITPQPQEGQVVMMGRNGESIAISNLNNPFMSKAWDGLGNLVKFKETGKTARGITGAVSDAFDTTAETIIKTQ